jgi:hypothetical protein
VAESWLRLQHSVADVQVIEHKQTQPVNRRAHEIRLSEPLSRFLAFVWGFQTDQGSVGSSKMEFLKSQVFVQNSRARRLRNLEMSSKKLT